MAKETLQDAYTQGVTRLNELEELYNKSPKNGEVRRNLINEISDLKVQLIYAKKHLLETEKLEYEAAKQWKNTNVAIERIASIQENLFNYNTLKQNGGDPEELKRLRQYVIDNLAFVDPKYANITDDRKLLLTVERLTANEEKSREEFSKILSELDKKNDAIKTDIYVDENRPDSDERMSRILEEKQKREELKTLIGTMDNSKAGVKGASLEEPTVKQHLEPILDIEEKLKAGVSPEEEKELKEKKEKMEKRLGKKWLIKLKIDKINSRIIELKQLLEGDISPEEKKKYQEELSKLNGELGVLQKEYGEVLAKIDDIESKIVEKSENEKKTKIDFDNEKNDKKDTKQPKDTEQPESTKQPNDKKQPEEKKNDTLDKTNERGTRGFTSTNIGTSSPVTSMQGVSNGNVVPIENFKNTTDSNSKNLPAVKKESLLDKIKARFESKKEPLKEKVKPEVLFSIEVGEDVVNQKLRMFENKRVPQVVGKDFYHIIREGDELQYVREPLTNIECNKYELVKKIKEVQEKYVMYYKGLYNEQKNNPLFANPNIIARKLIGFSNGIEKQQRILKAMCSLESAIYPQEAIDALNGKDTIIFRPGINGKGEYDNIMTTIYLDEGSALSQYAGKIKYKLNEPIREKAEKVTQINQKICEIDEKLSHSTPKTNNNLSVPGNVEKIRKNLGGITPTSKNITSTSVPVSDTGKNRKQNKSDIVR